MNNNDLFSIIFLGVVFFLSFISWVGAKYDIAGRNKTIEELSKEVKRLTAKEERLLKKLSKNVSNKKCKKNDKKKKKI